MAAEDTSVINSLLDRVNSLVQTMKKQVESLPASINKIIEFRKAKQNSEQTIPSIEPKIEEKSMFNKIFGGIKNKFSEFLPKVTVNDYNTYKSEVEQKRIKNRIKYWNNKQKSWNNQENSLAADFNLSDDQSAQAVNPDLKESTNLNDTQVVDLNPNHDQDNSYKPRDVPSNDQEKGLEENNALGSDNSQENIQGDPQSEENEGADKQSDLNLSDQQSEESEGEGEDNNSTSSFENDQEEDLEEELEDKENPKKLWGDTLRGMGSSAKSLLGKLNPFSWG